MDAPNRSVEVATVVNAHLDLLKPTPSDDSPEKGDARKRSVLPYICKTLNDIDGGHWGLLRKPGREFVASDTVVWRPTLDHFDVLMDSGPTWIARGRIEEGWMWVGAPLVTVDVEPDPQTEPEKPPPFDAAWIVNKIDDHMKQTQEFHIATMAKIDQLEQAAVKQGRAIAQQITAALPLLGTLLNPRRTTNAVPTKKKKGKSS